MIDAASRRAHSLDADPQAQLQGLRKPPKWLPEWDEEFKQAEYTSGMLLGFLRIIVPFTCLLLLGQVSAHDGKLPEDCWADPSGGGVLWGRRYLIASCIFGVASSLLVGLVAIITPKEKYWRVHEGCIMSWVFVVFAVAVWVEVCVCVCVVCVCVVCAGAVYRSARANGVCVFVCVLAHASLWVLGVDST